MQHKKHIRRLLAYALALAVTAITAPPASANHLHAPLPDYDDAYLDSLPDNNVPMHPALEGGEEAYNLAKDTAEDRTNCQKEWIVYSGFGGSARVGYNNCLGSWNCSYAEFHDWVGWFFVPALGFWEDWLGAGPLLPFTGNVWACGWGPGGAVCQYYSSGQTFLGVTPFQCDLRQPSVIPGVVPPPKL